MWSLLKAALVLAPVALAFEGPNVVTDLGWEGPATDHSFAVLSVHVPSSQLSPRVLNFRIDVFPSEEACGYGNITVNNQALSQTLNGDVLTGRNSILVEADATIVQSWTLQCIKVNGQPDSQFLKFIIEKVDGELMVDTGFTVLFKQIGATKVLSINNDLSTPDKVAANPNPEGLAPSHRHDDHSQYSVEDDMAELDWMFAQLHELKLMIAEKQEAIASHAYNHPEYFEEELKDCDSLKCVASAVFRKISHTAHEVYEKIAGEDDIFDEEFGHFPKPPFKKPHWPKIPKVPFHPGKGKHGNHTCGHHGKHGNHTGNHTHPHPPHWRKPHRFLPICRLPPHHGPPHDKPPHHQPPHHGPPPPHHESLPGDDLPQPPPPHLHQGPFLDDDNRSPPTPFEEDSEHRPPPDSKDFGPPRHRHVGKTLRIVKFGVIGFLLALLMIALHRRACSPTRRADRRARREERKRRRAFRRAAHKHLIRRFFHRISGHQADNESTADYEEKRDQLVSDSEDDISTTMSDEITQFRHAASVVDDMVSAEEGRARSVAYQHGHRPEPIPIPTREESVSMRGYEIGSQVGDGEELPAYEDNDGSEMSSMVADGFRYTPGSSDYSPQNSASGSVSDILGPDTKT